ncbi:hypothetical protein HDV00_008987 [Rhizophlyctis rosea]|nr:hypothetical protein HDV00_008987 [Rhizophlyctis rosea]
MGPNPYYERAWLHCLNGIPPVLEEQQQYPLFCDRWVGQEVDEGKDESYDGMDYVDVDGQEDNSGCEDDLGTDLEIGEEEVRLLVEDGGKELDDLLPVGYRLGHLAGEGTQLDSEVEGGGHVEHKDVGALHATHVDAVEDMAVDSQDEGNVVDLDLDTMDLDSEVNRANQGYIDADFNHLKIVYEMLNASLRDHIFE